MAVREREVEPAVLNYGQYANEGETPGRYEIVKGVREWMTSPHAYHQDIAQNIYLAFRTFHRTRRSGRAYMAPMDVVTVKSPLTVRQPDVLFISNERWGDRGPTAPMPLDIAPELVVEVLSPSETKRMIGAKMREYASANVLEAWIVRPEEKTVEVWQLSIGREPSVAARYGDKGSIVSRVFPGLAVDASSVFEF